MGGGDFRRGVGAGGQQRRAHLVDTGARIEEATRLQRQAGERAQVDHRGRVREDLGADDGGVRHRVGRVEMGSGFGRVGVLDHLILGRIIRGGLAGYRKLRSEGKTP